MRSRPSVSVSPRRRENLKWPGIHDQYPRDIVKPAGLKNDVSSMRSVECNYVNWSRHSYSSGGKTMIGVVWLTWFSFQYFTVSIHFCFSRMLQKDFLVGSCWNFPWLCARLTNLNFSNKNAHSLDGKYHNYCSVFFSFFYPVHHGEFKPIFLQNKFYIQICA